MFPFEVKNRFALMAIFMSSVCFTQICFAQTMVQEPVAPASNFATPNESVDGFAYPANTIVFVYPFEHPDLPDLQVLEDLIVLLSPTNGGWVGPTDGADVIGVRLGELGLLGVTNIYGSALAAINQSVRDFMEAQYGLIGHLVTPDASEIAYRTTRADLREAGDTQLTIMIWRAIVGEVRTVAHGDRLAERHAQGSDQISKDQAADTAMGEPESNVNRNEHQRTRDRLDIEPGMLLTRKTIDDEIYRLNRHPGRRVDAAVAPTKQPGEVIVDYLITEPKSWNVYVQTSNTGSESTDIWQQRVGYINRQLTGRDDVLQLDLITTAFDESNAVLGSYTFDFGPRTRLKLFGRWNEYTAKDVGFGFENFKGDGYAVGAEAAINVWQKGPKFVDFIVGVRGEHIHVENRLFLIEGSDDFLLPSVGLRYEKRTPVHSAFGQVTIESNWGSIVGSSKEDVQRLGRFGADDDFTIMRAQLSHSFFLEPILDPSGFKGERGDEGMTLAHEIAINFRAQYAFQSRLIPNYEFVAGGFYTVRGYEESAAVGDDAIFGSLEYRYHLGRSLPSSSESMTLFGQPFRSARTRPYGSADWDLIFKGFIDAARLGVNDAPFFEQAETLVGVGVGIETQLKSNLTLRLDYGMALTNIGQGANQTTSVGDTRLHFSAQMVF